jgi:hypothetical protein
MGFFWEGLPPYVLPWVSNLLGSNVMAIETGTFRGDTTLLLQQHFGRCRSVERSANLAQQARNRFSENNSIEIFEGSSRDVLPVMLPEPEVPCFFWLDAHGFYDYAGSDLEENPLLEELRSVLTNRPMSNTVIAIDDARGMGTQPGWPSVGAISALLEESNFHVVAFDDILLAVKTDVEPDLYDLYKRSRMVEVSSLFQVWSHVVRSVRNRARMDRLIGSFTRK